MPACSWRWVGALWTIDLQLQSRSQAFDEEHVDLDQERTGAVLYLHQQARRVSRLGGCSSLTA